jgi:hypothetical protein
MGGGNSRIIIPTRNVVLGNVCGDSHVPITPAGSTGRCTTIGKSQVLLKQEVLGPWAVLAAYKLIIGPFYEFRLSRSLSLNSLRLEQTSAGGASTP